MRLLGKHNGRKRKKDKEETERNKETDKAKKKSMKLKKKKKKTRRRTRSCPAKMADFRFRRVALMFWRADFREEMAKIRFKRTDPGDFSHDHLKHLLKQLFL